ncbi:MAG: hypothetical protein CML17_00795 [Pusillimonas sp.]|nr:hypothetical protein [Pusillimonas sp.]
MLRKTLLIIATGFPLASSASEMPRYDVEAQCKQIASMGGNTSAVMLNSCMDMEQKAYNNLKASWNEIPENTQRQCHEVASIGGNGSYTMLESCIEMETQAAEKPKKFEY